MASPPSPLYLDGLELKTLLGNTLAILQAISYLRLVVADALKNKTPDLAPRESDLTDLAFSLEHMHSSVEASQLRVTAHVYEQGISIGDDHADHFAWLEETQDNISWLVYYTKRLMIALRLKRVSFPPIVLHGATFVVPQQLL